MVKKNKFSILIALIIMYLSLADSHTFDKVSFINIPNFDKIVHFVMYFVLMFVITFENRKTIKGPVNLVFIGLIPFFYGILLEILQSFLTVNRTGSIYDALSDIAGIMVSILFWLWLKAFRKEIIK